MMIGMMDLMMPSGCITPAAATPCPAFAVPYAEPMAARANHSSHEYKPVTLI